jgi:hypothetical protein
MRNYVLGANQALAGDGVYIGIVPIGGLIRNSAAEAAVLNAPAEFENFDLETLKLTTLDPADIADVFWNLNATRDRVEALVGTGF